MKVTVASSALSVVLSVSAASALAQTAAPAPAASPATAAAASKEDAATLDTIVVTGTRAEVDNISTMSEVFRDSVEVNYGGPTTSSQKVYINGLEENNLNVQIDGARQSGNIWHHNAGTLLDPGILKAATVEAGVAPADIGPAALGGSLQYETRDVADLLAPGRSLGTFFGGAYDSNAETFTQSGAAYGRGQGFEALGYVSHGEGKNYEDGDGNEVQGTGVNLLSTLAKLAYEAPSGHRVELSGQYVEDDDRRPYRANFAAVRGVVRLADNQLTRRTATLGYSNTHTSALFAPEAQLYVNENEVSRPSPTGAFALGYFDSKATGVGGSARNTFITPVGRITAGADFFSDETETDNFRDSLYKEESDNLGLFAQLRGRPIDRVELSTGLRLDRQKLRSVDDQTYTNTGLSPNVSLNVAITSAVSLSGGYAYVFGGVPLAEAALFHSFPYAYSEDLDPQRARNGKLGLWYADGGLELGVEGFRTRLSNTAAYNEDPDPAVEDEAFLRINGPRLQTSGFNVSAAYSWGNARVAAVYTDTDVEYDGDDISTNSFNNGLPVGEILKLSGRYAFTSLGLVTGVSSEIASKFDYPADTGSLDLKSYEVYNAYVEWNPARVSALTLRLSANNLLDDDYINRFTPGASLGVVSPLKEPGRSFVLSSRLSF